MRNAFCGSDGCGSPIYRAIDVRLSRNELRSHGVRP